MQQLLLPGTIVKKSNALARARWTVESVWEPRLVALLASKIRVDDTEFQVYEIPVTEILQESDRGGKIHREIERVVDKIMSRVLTIRDEEGWTKYNVFFRCRYKPKKGVLELAFHPDLIPHYLQLQEQFAKWNLMEYLMLPSIYSQRIFEILKSWGAKPEVTIPLDELHEMLDTPESFRKDFRQFRVYVLEQAHKDIHKNPDSSLTFEWEPVTAKGNRRVVAIRFLFSARLLSRAKKAKAPEAKKTPKKKIADFRLAARCFQDKGHECRHEDKPAAVCRVCREMVQLRGGPPQGQNPR